MIRPCDLPVTVIPMTYEFGQKFYLTPFSDSHVDNHLCFRAKNYRRILAERKKLGSRFIAIGDLAEWIHLFDPRYLRTLERPNVDMRDDYITQVVEQVSNEMSVVDWDMLSMGNHETNDLKRRGVDVIEEIRKRVPGNPAHGAFAGYLVYQMRHISGGSVQNFVILYHHGAWGGALAKGYNGAIKWCLPKQNWNVFLFGHCHTSRVDIENRTRLISGASPMRAVEEDVAVVNCGTMRGTHPGGPGLMPDYSMIKGHPASPIGVPLITWEVVSLSRGTSVKSSVTLEF